MLKLKVQIGEFYDLICSIYLYKLLKLKWGKKEKLKDRVSRDCCYLCVNIIRSYICLGSNHQPRSRGAYDVCNKEAVRHDMTVI
jgi:hypothetical protein